MTRFRDYRVAIIQAHIFASLKELAENTILSLPLLQKVRGWLAGLFGNKWNLMTQKYSFGNG